MTPGTEKGFCLADDCAMGSPRDGDRSSRCAGSVLALGLRAGDGRPWWFWGINYTHFTLEASGSVFRVVYTFWSEKAKGSVASVPPSEAGSLRLDTE